MQHQVRNRSKVMTRLARMFIDGDGRPPSANGTGCPVMRPAEVSDRHRQSASQMPGPSLPPGSQRSQVQHLHHGCICALWARTDLASSHSPIAIIVEENSAHDPPRQAFLDVNTLLSQTKELKNLNYISPILL
jgi:hypothetical protein